MEHMHTVSSGGVNAPSQEMTAEEINNTITCLEKAAHSLMGIHQARNALSSAHQEFSKALYDLERVIATRGTYETICEDPLSGHQTYTVDAGRRKGLLAAGAFLETLARADEGLANIIGRVSRNIQFGIKEFQLNSLNCSSASNAAPAEISNNSKTRSKALKRFKNILMSSLLRMGSSHRGKRSSAGGNLTDLKQKESTLRTLTRDTKNIEAVVIERGIANIIELIFTHLKEPEFLEQLSKNKDSCLDWLRNLSDDESEYDSEKCMTPLDTGNLLDALPKIATTPGYCDHSTQVYPSIMKQMEDEDTISSDTLSEMSNATPQDTTVPGTSSSAKISTPMETHSGEKRPEYSYYEVGIDDRSGTENMAIEESSPRQSKHRRTRSVHTVPFMSGSGTTTRSAGFHPRIPVVYEENNDVPHETQPAGRKRAYTIVGINGGRRGVETTPVNGTYRFPDKSGGSSWVEQEAQAATTEAPINPQSSD